MSKRSPDRAQRYPGVPLHALPACRFAPYGLRRLDFNPIGSTPDEFAARIKSELATWTKVIREAGIKPM
jgi:hypothetical protein